MRCIDNAACRRYRKYAGGKTEENSAQHQKQGTALSGYVCESEKAYEQGQYHVRARRIGHDTEYTEKSAHAVKRRAEAQSHAFNKSLAVFVAAYGVENQSYCRTAYEKCKEPQQFCVLLRVFFEILRILFHPDPSEPPPCSVY